LSLNIDRYWRARTVRLVPPHGPLPILDLCTGTGDLALAYARAAAGTATVVGADFCREMLAVARRKSRRFLGSVHDSKALLIEADAEHLPLPDNTFQIVSVAFGLRNIADTRRGLAEMARVCVPGGRVAVLEFTTPRHKPLRTIYGWYFRRVLPCIGQAVSRSAECAYQYLPSSVGEFPQYEALATLMTAAGLIEVKFFPFTFGIATLYVGVKV
jgi:demethylmenaquinone methyltransferase/2-methoxy-6-polyprenyl-1,4-benzoquinol methylase